MYIPLMFAVSIFASSECVVGKIAQESSWRAVADNDRELMAEIDDGIRQWRDNLEYYGTFRYSQGVSTSMEDALIGKFVKLAAEPSGDGPSEGDLAKSVQVKLGNSFCHLFRVDEMSTPGPDGGVSWSSEEIIMANGVELRHSPLYRFKSGPIPFYGGTVHFRNISDKPANQFLGSTGLLGVSPFVLSGGNDGALLSPILENGVKEIRINNPETNVMEIALRTANETEVVFRVRSDGRYPVIEEVKTGVRVVYRARNFVDCGEGCLFPRWSVRAQGPYKTEDGTDRDYWISRVWVSTDLGERRPVPEDFVFDVPPDTTVYGLKQERMADKINFLNLTPDDLETVKNRSDSSRDFDREYANRPDPGERMPGASAGSPGSIWLFISAIGITGMFLIVLSHRMGGRR